MSTFLALEGMGALIVAVAWFTRWCHRRQRTSKRHTSRGIRRLERYANSRAAHRHHQPREEGQQP